MEHELGGFLGARKSGDKKDQHVPGYHRKVFAVDGVRTDLLVFSASNADKAPQRDFRPLKTSSLDAASLVIMSG